MKKNKPQKSIANTKVKKPTRPRFPEMPEIPEYEVFEAQIDRVRDIRPKNDKTK